MQKAIILFLCCGLFSCSSLVEKLPEQVRPEGVRAEKPLLNMVWAKNLDPSHNTGNLPIAVHSVEIYEGILYAGENTGHMAAYDLRNGRQLWRVEDNGGHHAGPMVYEEMLIYGTDQGRVYARDYMTGELIYSVDLDASIESAPIIEQGRLFFHLRNHKVFSLDAATGKILWAYKRSVPFLTTVQGVSKPLIDDDKIFVGFADGSMVALNLEDGVLLWESRLSQATKFVDVDVDPILYNNSLLVNSVSGEMKLIEPQTGNILRRIDITPSRSPLELPGQRLLIGTNSGELAIFGRHFDELSRIRLGRSPVTGLFHWKDGFLVTMASGQVFWTDRELSEKRVAFDMGHSHSSVLGEAKLSEGHLAFISSRNRLYVFR